MKKNKKNKILKYIFMLFFGSFLIVYFSEITGYYEYENNKKMTLTKEKIKEFESDVAKGKKIDINNYLVADKMSYNNSLSKLTNEMSNGISFIVQSGVEKAFTFIFKLVDE